MSFTRRDYQVECQAAVLADFDKHRSTLAVLPTGTGKTQIFLSVGEEFLLRHPDKIVLAIVNGKRPYVDRFVQLPDNGFEDDQKPTTRLFGEHCFWVRGKDYIVNVVSP